MTRNTDQIASGPPEFSVVISCYNEAASIDEFHRRLSATLASLGRTYEIVLVDDGSSDATWERIEAIFERDPQVAVALELFKNSGPQAAVTAGINAARGAVFVFIDSDLQLDPEQLPELIAAWDEGVDVVTGYRTTRMDSRVRQLGSVLANSIMRRGTGATLRDFGCTFKIIEGRLVRAFESGPRRVVRLTHLIAAARRCVEVPVRHHERPHGQSGWSVARLVGYAIDNLVEVTNRPFQFLSVMLFVAAFLYMGRLIVGIFIPIVVLPEVTHGLILSGIFLTALFLTGVLVGIGEYVIRSYLVLQGQPAYIVRSERRRAVPAAASENP